MKLLIMRKWVGGLVIGRGGVDSSFIYLENW